MDRLPIEQKRSRNQIHPVNGQSPRGACHARLQPALINSLAQGKFQEARRVAFVLLQMSFEALLQSRELVGAAFGTGLSFNNKPLDDIFLPLFPEIGGLPGA